MGVGVLVARTAYYNVLEGDLQEFELFFEVLQRLTE